MTVRLQVFYSAGFCCAVTSYLAVSQWSFLTLSCVILSIIILLLQGKWIYPYTPLAKQEVLASSKDAEHSIRIMSANVLMSNDRYEKLISLVNKNQPDLFIKLESDITWQQQLKGLEGDYPPNILS